MQGNKRFRSVLIAMGWLLFLILFGSTVAAGAFAPNQNSIMKLYLRVSDDQIHFVKYNITKGHIREYGDPYKNLVYEILDKDNNVLHRGRGMDPFINFFDATRKDGSLKTTSAIDQPNDFVLRVPYYESARKIRFSRKITAVRHPASDQSETGNENKILNTVDLTAQRPGAEPHGIGTAIPSWNVETLLDNGNPANRIDLVYLGDGFTEEELDYYQSEVNASLAGLFEDYDIYEAGLSPVEEYMPYFNVHRVDVISNESGADHLYVDPPILKDTALDAHYGPHPERSLMVEGTKAAEAADLAPDWDTRLVLVNDIKYGGAGWFDLRPDR